MVLPYYEKMASLHKSPRLLHMDKQGRLIIPADLRKALEVEPNSDLIATLEGKQLVLRPRGTTERELWEMFSNVEGSLKDELLGERRAEAEREG